MVGGLPIVNPPSFGWLPMPHPLPRFQDDEIRAVATVNRDPIAVVCAELMRRGRMPSVSELMLGTVTWSTSEVRCVLIAKNGRQ